MVTCDVCNASTTWEEGTAYTADEFRTIVRMGFEPPAHVIALLPNGLQGWKYGLVANSTTGWLLCPSCARRAVRYMPKPAGTGPAGHVLHETMARSQMLGLDPESLINRLADSTPPPGPAQPAEEPKPARTETETIWGKTKTCPNCSREIEAAATSCPNCEAKFAVSFRGYCSAEHTIVECNDKGMCSKCGKEVLDFQVQSRMTEIHPVPKQAEAEVEPIKIQPTAPPEPAALAPTTKSPQTKICPRCAEEIKAEARLCRYCRAKFIVTVKGYCPNDRQVVEAGADGKCPKCQGELIDIHVDSKLVEEVDITPSGVMQKQSEPAVQMSQPAPVPPAELKRPGCVTAYAILLWIGAAFLALGALAIPSSLPASSREFGTPVAVIMLGMAILTIAIGSGLWQLKNWARILVIVLMSLSLVSNLITGFGVLFSPASSRLGGAQNPGALCGYFIGIAISVSMLRWFIQNKQYFIHQESVVKQANRVATQTGVVNQSAPMTGSAVMNSSEFAPAMATARNRHDQVALDYLVRQRIRCDKCKAEVTVGEALHVNGMKVGENMYRLTSNPSLVCPRCGACWIQF